MQPFRQQLLFVALVAWAASATAQSRAQLIGMAPAEGTCDRSLQWIRVMVPSSLEYCERISMISTCELCAFSISETECLCLVDPEAMF